MMHLVHTAPRASTAPGRRAALVTAFDPARFCGGIERFTLELAALLETCGWSCTLHHADHVDPTSGFANPLLARLHALGQEVVRGRYDLVICNNFYGLALFPPDGRVVNVFHATHAGFAEATEALVDRRTTLEWRWLWGEMGDRPSGFGRRLVAVSEGVREELERHYGLFGATVVEHGVDVDRFAPAHRLAARRALGLSGDGTVGIFVGRFDVTKGSDVVAAVIRACPDVRWLLVTGSGSPATGCEGLPNVVTFHEVEPLRLAALYTAADVLLFPSRYEGFGLVILEAMACGLPVVATPVGVMRSLLGDPLVSSFALPPPETPAAALTAACLARIAELRHDPGRAAEAGRRGRELVMARFTKGRWRERMAAALELSRG